MKKQDLKTKVSEAFRADVPKLRAEILASCEKEEQLPTSAEQQKTEIFQKRLAFSVTWKRVAACAMCLLLFVSGLSVGLFGPNFGTSDAATSVYLDVNPSIELRIDEDDTVTEFLAANEDADVILANLKLEGVDMNTALTAIVGSMYMNGYLSEDSNSILVSVDTENAERRELLLTDIADKISSVLEKSGIECSIIAQSIETSDDLTQRAIQNGISVGKMFLIDKMIGGMDEFENADANKLSGMSIKELNSIYSARPNKGTADDPFGNDISVESVSKVIEPSNFFTLLLNELEADISDVEWYQIQVGRQDGQMVYMVSIRFYGDPSTYEFTVNFDASES